MGIVIRLPEPDYFGNCPKCGRNDGRVDIGPDYWCFCHKHRVKWWICSDLFPHWKEPAEATWKKNTKKLAGYTEIKPLYRYPGRNKLTE